MARWLPRLVGFALVAIHGYLALWATVGLIEWFTDTVPWPRVSNPLFTAQILMMHWLLIGFAGYGFLAAWFARWRYTPELVALAYLGLATGCAIETFGYLVHDTKFVDMALEYATYVAILVLLYRAPFMRRRFGRT